jgi:folate-binding protein YgfZ
VFSEDVVVEDASRALSQLILLGPASAKALSIGPLKPFESRRVRFAGVEVITVGNDDFGVPGIDLFAEAQQKSAVLGAVVESGVIQVDETVLETMRIEGGVPRFGVDMDEDTIPLEAGIEDRAISLTKGCYVGQEIIIRVLHRGHGRVARRLVGLMLPEGGPVPEAGERVRSGEREIGFVTSSTWSPALGRPVGLGYVHRDFVEAGTSVHVGPQAATVSALPFIVPATR